MKLFTHNFPLKEAPLLVVALFFFSTLPNQEAFAQTESEKIYQDVDEMPTPPNGIDGWNSYLAKNMKYPKAAR